MDLLPHSLDANEFGSARNLLGRCILFELQDGRSFTNSAAAFCKSNLRQDIDLQYRFSNDVDRES